MLPICYFYIIYRKGNRWVSLKRGFYCLASVILRFANLKFYAVKLFFASKGKYQIFLYATLSSAFMPYRFFLKEVEL